MKSKRIKLEDLETRYQAFCAMMRERGIEREVTDDEAGTR